MDAPVPTFVDDRLAHWASADPDGDCMTYGQRTWTWAQFHDRVRRVAGGLRDLGVGRGDVVAFLDKNHPACVELSLGAGLIGAANAVVNWRLAGEEVGFTLNDCGAKVLVVGSELMPAIEAIRGDLPQVTRVIEVTTDGATGDPYEEWLAASAPADPDRARTADDTCLVLYSSGTTGRPKGVELTHTNFVRHTIASHDGWDFEPGDKNLVAMPLFHVGGSSYVLFGLHDGIPSVMTREPDGMSLAGAILQGANRMFLVPAVLAQVIQSGPQGIDMFSRLKSFTYGAAPMPPPLLRAAMKTWPDMDLMQVYGLTEVCGVATHLLPEEHRQAEAEGHPERLLSAGRAIPGMEVRIVDVGTLEDVPTGEPGEIWLRSEQVMKGFLGRPDETAKAVTPDGWFRTGDRRVRLRRGPAQGHDHQWRREHLLTRGRAGAFRAPGRARVRGRRRPGRAVGRVGAGVRRPATRRLDDRGRHHRVLPRAAGPLQVPPLGGGARGAAPQPDREDPQARPARSVIARSAATWPSNAVRPAEVSLARSRCRLPSRRRSVVT